MPHLKRTLTGAICAALCLWCASATPLFADSQPKPLTAIFIEAHGELPDPNFGDSTVLVMNNLAPAPVGIIINRPTKITVSQLFPEMKRLAQVHDRVYFGGPVEFDTVWFLFRAPKPPEHAVLACEGVYLSASREQLVKLLERSKPMEGLRIFIGHSGWGPGQLESEIEQGAWTLKHAEPDAIFQHKADHPWPAPESSEPQT